MTTVATKVQNDWIADFLGLDEAILTDDGPAIGAGGNGSASGAPSGPVLPSGQTGNVAATPSATATDLFFDDDSPKLTGSDRQSLDAYAQAYLDANSSEHVTIEGFACKQGNEIHNQQLSQNRAQAVAAYLIGRGIPKDKVAGVGRGPTDAFSQDDPSQNRRATIKPPPPAAPAQPPSSPPAPAPVTDWHKQGEEAAKRVVGDSSDVPRAVVERKLKEFLGELAKVQKNHGKVRTTDKVWEWETTLRLGLEGAGVVKRGVEKDYEPDELASDIAGALPDTIPGANYNAFLKLKPRDVPDPGSFTDQVRRKYREGRDALIHHLPKSLQEPAKKAIDTLIAKGVPFGADEVLKAMGIDPNVESEAKKAVEDYIKKVTSDGDNK